MYIGSNYLNETSFVCLEQEKAWELQTLCHSQAMKAARLVQSTSEQKNEQLVRWFALYAYIHLYNGMWYYCVNIKVLIVCL